jgi:hypothetical protein
LEIWTVEVSILPFAAHYLIPIHILSNIRYILKTHYYLLLHLDSTDTKNIS